MKALGVPPALWNPLYKKLTKETFDAGSVFQFVQFADDEEEEEEGEEVEEGTTEETGKEVHGEDEESSHTFAEVPKRKLRLQVVAEEMKARSNVYLVDHAWTTSPEEARKQLRATPNLLERMINLMEVDRELSPVRSPPLLF